MEDKAEKFFNKIAHIIEYIIIGLILIGVGAGLKNLVKMIIDIYSLGDLAYTYENFSYFLSYVLILIVGIEFVLMLITPSMEGTLRLVMYVVTRKMLIYASSMMDVMLGSIAVLLIVLSIKIFKINKLQNPLTK